MSELNKDTIKYLSQLCRIHFSDKDQEQIVYDLKKILDYVEQLQELNTDDIKPCNHVLESMVNCYREDKIGDTMPRENFMANAPDKIGGMIKVPTIIKQN